MKAIFHPPPLDKANVNEFSFQFPISTLIIMSSATNLSKVETGMSTSSYSLLRSSLSSLEDLNCTSAKTNQDSMEGRVISWLMNKGIKENVAVRITIIAKQTLYIAL